ncbi:MAG: lamin tail domain-containing protein [Myxococcota bacterium]
MISVFVFFAACSGGSDPSKDDTAAAGPDVPAVVINEFVADNKTYADPDGDPVDTGDLGEFDDWIELYNADDAAVPLDGFYLTDDLDQPTRWALPTGVTLEPGEFYLVWADGQPEQGDGNHADFSLEKNGETLGLYFATDGGEAWANKVDFGEQATDRSSARIPDGSMDWEAGVEPTPGASNG